MTEDQIKHMVTRFLQWKLPENFFPDGGISFEPLGSKGTPWEFRREPFGTNLLTYVQAEAMLRYMLEGLPADPQPGDVQAAMGLATALAPEAERELVQDILHELVRARRKFPGKNVTFAALVEEIGELAKATFEQSAERVRREAVQVAVMAMRMVLDGDHTFEPWRAEKGLDPLDPALRRLHRDKQ